jgi:putative transposase
MPAAQDGTGFPEKSSGLLREPEPVRFSFIAEQAAEKAFPIAFMCRMLGVSRQGFYQWRDRPPSRRALDDAALTERITKIHTAHGRRVGVRRVRDELARAGVVCSHKRTHRLMRAAGLRGVHPKPYKRTTLSGRFDPSLVDLLRRDFAPTAPDLAWVGDITYVKTWTGWAYLATVIDCYSRRVVGWAIADHMRTDLITDALRMAIAARNPPPGVIFHSDRGSVHQRRIPWLLPRQRCAALGRAHRVVFRQRRRGIILRDHKEGTRPRPTVAEY